MPISEWTRIYQQQENLTELDMFKLRLLTFTILDVGIILDVFKLNQALLSETTEPDDENAVPITGTFCNVLSASKDTQGNNIVYKNVELIGIGTSGVGLLIGTPGPGDVVQIFGEKGAYTSIDSQQSMLFNDSYGKSTLKAFPICGWGVPSGVVQILEDGIMTGTNLFGKDSIIGNFGSYSIESGKEGFTEKLVNGLLRRYSFDSFLYEEFIGSNVLRYNKQTIYDPVQDQITENFYAQADATEDAPNPNPLWKRVVTATGETETLQDKSDPPKPVIVITKDYANNLIKIECYDGDKVKSIVEISKDNTVQTVGDTTFTVDENGVTVVNGDTEMALTSDGISLTGDVNITGNLVVTENISNDNFEAAK